MVLRIKKTFLIFIYLIFTISLYAQNNRKNSLSIGLHYAILGQGDYEGVMITNHFNYRILPYLEVSPSLGYLTSYRQSEISIVETYLANHLLGEFSTYLIPINLKLLFLKIGGGASFRLRKEVLAYGVYFDNLGIIEKVILKESAFDIGYSLQAILGTNVNQHFSLNARMSLQNYNEGTQVVTFGLIGTYKL